MYLSTLDYPKMQFVKTFSQTMAFVGECAKCLAIKEAGLVTGKVF